jgi:molybdenum cofactor guanylyltransferase
MSLAVVVLAGGEGRRMGGAKPLRQVGGVSLLSHALRLARQWSPCVAVAVRNADQAGGDAGVPLLLDPPGVAGPAAGLSSGLAFARAAGAELLLTLPCDSPRLPPDLPHRLAAEIGAAAVAVPQSQGRLHPVCALWRTHLAQALPAYLASGRSSLQGFARQCGAAVVEWQVEDGDDPFLNINTPEDLSRL